MSELSNGEMSAVAAKFLYGSSCSSQQSFLIAEMLLQRPRVSRIYQIVKRGLDICGALLGLIILLLVLLVVAPLILIEDRGSVFYKQARVGQYGKPFFIYKLRSMIMDADSYLAQRPELLNAWRVPVSYISMRTRALRVWAASCADPALMNCLKCGMCSVGR